MRRSKAWRARRLTACSTGRRRGASPRCAPALPHVGAAPSLWAAAALIKYANARSPRPAARPCLRSACTPHARNCLGPASVRSAARRQPPAAAPPPSVSVLFVFAAQIWEEVFSRADQPKRLAMVYLANDIIQNGCVPLSCRCCCFAGFATIQNGRVLRCCSCTCGHSCGDATCQCSPRVHRWNALLARSLPPTVQPQEGSRVCSRVLQGGCSLAGQQGQARLLAGLAAEAGVPPLRAVLRSCRPSSSAARAPLAPAAPPSAHRLVWCNVPCRCCRARCAT